MSGRRSGDTSSSAATTEGRCPLEKACPRRQSTGAVSGGSDRRIAAQRLRRVGLALPRSASWRWATRVAQQQPLGSLAT